MADLLMLIFTVFPGTKDRGKSSVEALAACSLYPEEHCLITVKYKTFAGFSEQPEYLAQRRAT
jgi:hypothetical protein